MTARRDALREKLLDEVPWWYNPWLHLAIPAVIGLGLITAAALLIRDLKPIEVGFAVALLLASNAAEWRLHKTLLHHRWPGPLGFFFTQHTPQHHGVYVHGDMAMRSRREFRLVLIPAYGIVGIFVLTSPLIAWLEYAGERNLAALFVICTMGYMLSYEWLHLAYHMPPDSFVGRRRIVRVLRRHHSRHHAPELMQNWNFNVTIPLWDFVRRTIHPGPVRGDDGYEPPPPETDS